MNAPNGSSADNDDDEVLKEFLVESHENLDQLDRDFVALEANPGAQDRIAAIFRTVHTIKGTAGFLGFGRLETLTHGGETLLCMLRDGQIPLTAELTSALLAMVDRVRAMLAVVEATGGEGEDNHQDVLDRLALLKVQATASAATATAGGEKAPEPAAAPEAPTVARPSVAPRVLSPATAAPPEPTPVVQVAPAPPPAAAPAPAALAPVTAPVDTGASGAPAAQDTTVRVDVGLLDKLMNLVGELVLARNQILQFGNRVEDAGFVGASQRLNHVATELQEHVMKTRMQPIGNVWSKLPRIVRDLAIQCGKQVRVEMVGKETELDRTIIEAIKDPLLHIVRNAVDHGIETPEVRAGNGKARTGTLTLRAFHEGGQVNIEISDDGRGLAVENIRRKAVERGLVPADRASRLTDREVSQLVFLPGFSTAAKVTNVSGRGVGMDVVKSNIERIGGTVDLVSPPGGGTKIKIKIPLTLAIVPALTVVSAGQRYAIPQVNLLELVRLDGEQARASIENVYGKPVYRLRGRLLPLVFLNEQFKRRVQTAGNDEAVNIVVLQADDRQFGLIVDEVRDTEEIVVKPLGKELKGLSVFAGATVMGDGRVALILDVIGLAQLAGAMGRDRDRSPVVTARTTQTATDGGQDTEKQTLLLFGVGDDTTMAVPLSAVARLEEFPTARLERAGGKLVVQYRNELLPLVEVAAAVGKSGWKPNDTVHVIVYSAGGQSVGFVVTKILDVVNGTLKVERATRRPGLLGATILQDRVTELLDVEGLVRSHYPSFYERDVA